MMWVHGCSDGVGVAMCDGMGVAMCDAVGIVMEYV